MCCGLKRYFDAQRVDEAGRSAVRLQKSVMILFLISLFGFSYALFTLIFGGKMFGLVLVCSFLMYWSILYVGFKGARRRNAKMITTYFASKLIFDTVLIGLLALVAAASFGLLAFINIEVSAAVDNNEDYYDDNTDYYENGDEGDDYEGDYQEGDEGDDHEGDYQEEPAEPAEPADPADDTNEADDATDPNEENPDDYEDGDYEDGDYYEDGLDDSECMIEDCEPPVEKIHDALLVVDLVFAGFWTIVGVFMLPHVVASVVSLFLAVETRKKLRKAGTSALPVAVIAGTAAPAPLQKADPSAPAAPTPTVVYAPPPAMDAARVMHYYPHADASAAGGYTPMVYVMPTAPPPSTSE